MTRRASSACIALAAAFAFIACGDSNDSGLNGGSGGSAQTGGSANAGGAAGTGGASAGGTAGAGGVPATGGTPSSGGVPSTGGAPSTGGVPSTGGAPSTGGVPGTGGAPAVTCQDLDGAYQKALTEAKVCVPGGSSQCTSKVMSDIACGCPTFVNHNNPVAIQAMDKLKNQWNTKKCSKACPEIACVEPTGAACKSSGSGSGGKCTDLATTN